MCSPAGLRWPSRRWWPETFHITRTSGPVAMLVALRQVGSLVAAAGDRPAGVAVGAAQAMLLTGVSPAGGPLAAPGKRRWVGVPAADARGQPGLQIVGALGML